MRNRTIKNKTETVSNEQTEVMIEGVRFWRECPADDKPIGFLPMKLVFSADNLNWILVFFESHGLVYSDKAVLQIRQEIETHGEADVWLLTYPEVKRDFFDGELAKGQ